ncbi:AAA family ATPase [Rhodobacter sp. NSM]|uniref:AAA family ATPase n=1 Tax=Rhodobacter sp. NSM TaxID=3457501 RepID=UPI003FD1F9F0
MGVNTMPVSTGEAFEVLLHGWEAQRSGGMMVSWMLHGRPGIGKTEIVQQLAERTGSMLFDLRLTTIEPQDLRGLPYYDHASQKTVWYRPEDLPDDPERPAILFLDELTAAAPNLQPTVYGLLQERRVGRHRLPPSAFIVAAGNRVEDGAVAYEMGTALSDRLIHLNLRADAPDWLLRYALPQGLHPTVIAFIRTRPDLLETTEEALRRGQMIACTPRSWARVSTILQQVSDRRMRDVMVAGTVGEAAAAEFALIADDIAATVQVTELLAARDSARTRLYPATMHGLTALIYGLVAMADAQTLPEIIEIMAEIRHLGRRRDEEVFLRMPLAELSGYGFEILIQKALDNGWQHVFLQSRAYQAYAAERRAAGLE